MVHDQIIFIMKTERKTKNFTRYEFYKWENHLQTL